MHVTLGHEFVASYRCDLYYTKDPWVSGNYVFVVVSVQLYQNVHTILFVNEIKSETYPRYSRFYVDHEDYGARGDCAISRKVTGSIPNEVDFFSRPNPSSRNMTLRSTQPLTAMSTRKFLGDKDGRCIGLTNLAPSVSRLSRANVRVSTSHNPMAFTACYRDSFTFFFLLLS
jgi:hypothetical protein